MTDFAKELLELLNKHSKENESNTPDFILADYLIGCLRVFNESVNNRQIWYKTDNQIIEDYNKPTIQLTNPK